MSETELPLARCASVERLSRAEAIERARAAAESSFHVLEYADRLVAGRGPLPDDPGRRGRVFSAAAELRWDEGGGLLLREDGEPRPLSFDGLEALVERARVMPAHCLADRVAYFEALRVLRHGDEQFLRFVEAIDA